MMHPLYATGADSPVSAVSAECVNRAPFNADAPSLPQVVTKEAFDANVPVALVAARPDFPDALAAGGLAVTRGGPMLPTLINEVPASLLEALAGFGSKRAVMVDGPGEDSDGVKARLIESAGLQNK